MYKKYFDELEPKKRLEILNSIPENERDDDYDLVYKLYHERYSDHDNKGRKNVDWWLWRCVCLQMLCEKRTFFKKSRDREVMKISDELLMNDTEKSHENFLYLEYRNVARRYLSTCKDPNYASSLLGLRRANDDEKVYRACSDIWQMSKGVAKFSGLEEKMSLWCKALRDELFEYNPICRAEYERLDG